jgi:prevent-host-death family protein
MTHLEATRFSSDLRTALDRVSEGKERIVLSSEGRDLAVLVPIEDLTLLEELEDQLDVQAAEAAEAEAAAKGELPIPWEEARKQLGSK